MTIKAGNGIRPLPIGHEGLNEHWVGAGHLLIGDKLRLADGRVGEVRNVTTEAKTLEMFNLTVEQAHTFYVGTQGWLVHNGGVVCEDGINITHIFEGETKGMVSKGFHSTAGDAWIGKAEFIGPKRYSPSGNNTYEALIRVYNPHTQQWAEPKKSTFFPDKWSRDKVIYEISGAFANGRVGIDGQSRKWEGISPSGIKVEGWLDHNGDILSAYPIVSYLP